jgi:hypothetical protein
VSNGPVIGLIAVVAVVVVAALVTRSRRAHDGVDSFRRQIDALSPEARRPVIDQVQNAAGRTPRQESDEESDEESEEASAGEPGDHDDRDGSDHGDANPRDDPDLEGGLGGT